MEKPPEYKTQYGTECICPYCEAVQDMSIDGDAWEEEAECDVCEGRFKYDVETTIEVTCYPIDGEGPKLDENGNPVNQPKFKDPNQLNLFEMQG